MTWDTTMDGWDGGSAATLALVIGVSRYPHLANPSGKAGRDTFGLSELNVSALTAYRFAEWLRESYHLSGRPLARCWLLASPTEDELQAEPGLADVREPTFRNCEDAIWEWYMAARDLPVDHAKNSRLLFFFSGHGLERMQDEQLLLPSDYLERGLVNRSINLRDLRQGLAACGIPEQIFLIDACRNDHSRLRDLGMSLTGTQVLNPLDNSRSSAVLDAPVLYGSSSGQQAFGPRLVKDGLTLFGQALLSGLTAPPAKSVEHNGDTDQCLMLVQKLQEYMNARIAELLVSYQSNARQSVTMGGQSAGPFVMSELACDAVTPIGPPSVRDSESKGRSSVDFADLEWGGFIGDSQGEDLFGDAVMAQLWSQRQLELLDPDPDSQMPELALVRVDRRGTSLYDLVIRIDGDPRMSILRLNEDSDGAGRSFECYLPWAGNGALFALHLTRDDNGKLVHIATDLDLQNPGVLGLAAETWRTSREQSAVAAVPLLPDDELAGVVSGASPSPLPVVVAGLVRLSAGYLLDREMLEDVAGVYPDWPDPIVLLIESLRREHAPFENIPRPRTHSVPRTAEVIAMAWRQLPDMTFRNPNALGYEERLARLVPWVQSGSLFPVILNPVAASDDRS